MMKKIHLIVFACIGHVTHAFAAQPLIPFQGHLTVPSETDPNVYEPVPAGQYDVLFTLYTAPAGGESKVWGPERHGNVTVVNGLVNAIIGSVEELPEDDPGFFARPLYVGITIDADGNPATPDLELVPRQVWLPEVYAAQAGNAQRLRQRTWTDFFLTQEPGSKAQNADLLDGIDSAAIFTNPQDTITPKVQRAAVADEASSLASNSIETQDLQQNAVTTDKIAAAAITTEKILAGAVTKTKLSDPTGVSFDIDGPTERLDNSSTSELDLGLSVTVTSVGRPILVGLSGYQFAATNGAAFLRIRRQSDDVVVDEYILDGNGFAVVPLSILTIDAPPSGTHTYTVTFAPNGAGAGRNSTVENVRLFALEL